MSRFAFSGFSATRHVFTAVPAETFVTVPGAPKGPQVEVDAPATGVELPVPWSMLRLEPDPPLASTSWGVLTVTGTEGTIQRGFRGTKPLPRLACAPGEGLHVRVECHGRESWEGDVVAPDAGREALLPVPLLTGGLFATLEVEVETGDIEGLDQIGLRPQAVGVDSRKPLFIDQAPVKDGVAVFSDLPTGEFDVILDSPKHGSWLLGTCEGQKCRVTLVAGEEARLQVELQRGGRLSLDARDARGVLLRTRVELCDAGGEVLPVRLVTYWEGRVAEHTTDYLTGGGPAATTKALAPGAYEVRFELDGYASRTVRATVHAGTVTVVETVLEAVLETGLEPAKD